MRSVRHLNLSISPPNDSVHGKHTLKTRNKGYTSQCDAHQKRTQNSKKSDFRKEKNRFFSFVCFRAAKKDGHIVCGRLLLSIFLTNLLIFGFYLRTLFRHIGMVKNTCVCIHTQPKASKQRLKHTENPPKIHIKKSSKQKNMIFLVCFF